MKTGERNAFASSDVPAALRGCAGLASALCSAGKTSHFSTFFLPFIFLSLSDICYLHNCTQLWHSKAASLLRADRTPFSGRHLSAFSRRRLQALGIKDTEHSLLLCPVWEPVTSQFHLSAWCSLLRSARCPSSALKVFMPRLTTPCTHCT